MSDADARMREAFEQAIERERAEIYRRLERSRQSCFKQLGLQFVVAAFFSLLVVVVRGAFWQPMLALSTSTLWGVCLWLIAVIQTLDDRADMLAASADDAYQIDRIARVSLYKHMRYRFFGRDPMKLYRDIK